MGFTTKKETDEIKEFDIEKFRRSITRPGTSPALIEELVENVQKNASQFKTSEDIFRYTFESLKQKEPYAATKYNVKRAILEFGPTGF